MLIHSILLHTVSQKHHFFDSGLLYEFCINFRRRRRLSELLHETEIEEQECTTQQNQDDQTDNPFTQCKTPPSEGNSNFSSGSKMITLVQKVQMFLYAPQNNSKIPWYINFGTMV